MAGITILNNISKLIQTIQLIVCCWHVVGVKKNRCNPLGLQRNHQQTITVCEIIFFKEWFFSVW